MFIAKTDKSILSIVLTCALLIAAIVFLSFPELTQGVSLWIDVMFFSFLNVGLIVALVIGIKTKNKSVMLFSIIINSALFVVGLFIIFVNIFVNVTI